MAVLKFNPDHLKILKQGVEKWNIWRNENPNIRPNLSSANLSSANLISANLISADLRLADLSEADLFSADLISADLRSADLFSANLSEASLRSADLRSADLRSADLRLADLRLADLSEADLSEADLFSASLFSADLFSADLFSADLRSADLRSADLRSADLRSADLRSANLCEANLISASLSEANLSEAKFGFTPIGDVDLREIRGLSEIEHLLPSHLSTDSIARSHGNIPDTFLKGIGLSPWEIESVKLYNPDLTPNERIDIIYKMENLLNEFPIQFQNLFISYSHSDSSFIEKVEEQLKKKEIRYWRDIHDMVAGPIEKQIDRAIKLNETILLVLSKNSIKSDWVLHEVRKAGKLEMENNSHVICPIALDDSWENAPWPDRIKDRIMEYKILDFSDWENDSSFDDNFEKLIKGLNLFYKK